MTYQINEGDFVKIAATSEWKSSPDPKKSYKVIKAYNGSFPHYKLKGLAGIWPASRLVKV